MASVVRTFSRVLVQESHACAQHAIASSVCRDWESGDLGLVLALLVPNTWANSHLSNLRVFIYEITGLVLCESQRRPQTYLPSSWGAFSNKTFPPSSSWLETMAIGSFYHWGDCGAPLHVKVGRWQGAIGQDSRSIQSSARSWVPRQVDKIALPSSQLLQRGRCTVKVPFLSHIKGTYNQYDLSLFLFLDPLVRSSVRQLSPL